MPTAIRRAARIRLAPSCQRRKPWAAVVILFTNPIHPLTFKPEFIDAFELGTKNTLLDGSFTFNADIFYYNYENYSVRDHQPYRYQR